MSSLTAQNAADTWLISATTMTTAFTTLLLFAARAMEGEADFLGRA